MPKNTRILIVDDDQVLRPILVEKLSETYKVQFASNGEEAWQILKQDPSINLVISDIEMPALNGIDLLKRIKKSYPHLGVIMISGSSDTRTAISAMRAGAYDYITKPITELEELKLIIKRWLYQQSLESKLIQYAELHREMMNNMKIRTFLSIDVVGSKRLKSREDPFLVQFSFQEYQKLVAQQVTAFNGDIHSTSGDGAMACFVSAVDACRSAQAILERLSDFNSRGNRLSNPFTVRLAAHTGPVILDTAGKISETYAETLDIAGHMQKNAAAGVLEISSTTRESLGNILNSETTDRIVDGFPTYQVYS